jgi:beta-glucanase (GH16 family)
MRRILPDLALALSGWAALAATALPSGAAPLRVALTAAFLLVCPGLAAVRASRRTATGRARPPDTMEDAMLSVALSVALDTLVAVGFYLDRSFTVPRALGLLAALTTALALLALLLSRRGRRSEPQRQPEGEPAPPGRTRGTAARQRGRRPGRQAAVAAAAAALLLTAACGGGGGVPGVASVASTGTGTGSGGPSAAAIAPVAPGPWHVVFQDDFTGTALNTANWATCYDWNENGCTNAGNRELEWYLPGQVTVGGGSLQLTATRTPTQGSDGTTYPWTSGMVSTGRDSWNATPRHTFTYGYFAAAIQIPPQPGMFPAFWLLAAQHDNPAEIDAAEFIGSIESIQMTVHWQTADGRTHLQYGDYGPVDFPAGVHVFAVDWEPTSLTWYVDGVVRLRITKVNEIPTTPMELLLDLAVGYPTAPPPGVDSAVMRVDWVRVWQH